MERAGLWNERYIRATFTFLFYQCQSQTSRIFFKSPAALLPLGTLQISTILKLISTDLSALATRPKSLKLQNPTLEINTTPNPEILLNPGTPFQKLCSAEESRAVAAETRAWQRDQEFLLPGIGRGGAGGGGGVYPTLQPESLLYNQNPHFTTHKLFRNPHFATGCEGFLTSLLTDNVKAWNLQHHPITAAMQVGK